MNVPVLHNVPVANLSDDLQRKLQGVETVTITPEQRSRKPMTKKEFQQSLQHVQEQHRGRGVTIEEAVARVRELRDEWDD